MAVYLADLVAQDIERMLERKGEDAKRLIGAGLTQVAGKKLQKTFAARQLNKQVNEGYKEYKRVLAARERERDADCIVFDRASDARTVYEHLAPSYPDLWHDAEHNAIYCQKETLPELVKFARTQDMSYNTASEIAKAASQRTRAKGDSLTPIKENIKTKEEATAYAKQLREPYGLTAIAEQAKDGTWQVSVFQSECQAFHDAVLKDGGAVKLADAGIRHNDIRMLTDGIRTEVQNRVTSAASDGRATPQQLSVLSHLQERGDISQEEYTGLVVAANQGEKNGKKVAECIDEHMDKVLASDVLTSDQLASLISANPAISAETPISDIMAGRIEAPEQEKEQQAPERQEQAPEKESEAPEQQQQAPSPKTEEQAAKIMEIAEREGLDPEHDLDGVQDWTQEQAQSFIDEHESDRSQGTSPEQVKAARASGEVQTERASLNAAEQDKPSVAEIHQEKAAEVENIKRDKRNQEHNKHETKDDHDKDSR